MEVTTRFKIRSFRNYLALIGEEYEERRWGRWEDIDTVRGVNHVCRPDGLDGLMATPFVLVETSHYGQTWITLWPDPDAAVDYHQGQEYAEDWTVQRIVDVRDMTEYRLSAKAVKA